MQKHGWIKVLVALVVITGTNLTAGCGESENPPANGGQQAEGADAGAMPGAACVPGDTKECPCIVAGELKAGAQECAVDGEKWTKCVCPEPGEEILAPICQPGRAAACSCPDGSTGAQSCAQNGLGWDACMCANTPAEGEDFTCGSNEDCPVMLCQHFLGCIISSDGPHSRQCHYLPKECPLGLHCEFNDEGDWCSPYCRDSRDCPTGWECKNRYTWQAACVPPCDHPAAETCDGVDNDCDGATDEDFMIGQSCWGVVGSPCAAEGVFECYEGAVLCSTDPGGSDDRSQEEICNNRDDDCDGAIDEDNIICPQRTVVFNVVEPANETTPFSFEGRSFGGDALLTSMYLYIIPEWMNIYVEISLFLGGVPIDPDHVDIFMADGETYRFDVHFLYDATGGANQEKGGPPTFQACASAFMAEDPTTGDRLPVEMVGVGELFCGFEFNASP